MSSIAGVLENTNRVVSSSKSSWNYILPGNFFRISGDSNFYEILRAKNFTFSEEFAALNEDTIQIPKDVGADLLIGDEIFVIYSIYEFVTIFKVVQSGIGYKVGEKVKLDINNATSNTFTGQENYTSLEITEVNSDGGIVKFSIVKKGSYLTEPPTNCSIISQSGKGAVFQCLFEQKFGSKIEREIVEIERNIPTTIKLNYGLPANIKTGIVNVNKWEMYIAANHAKTIYDAKFEVIKDFTLNYKFPLLLPGSFSKEQIFNKIANSIDSKLKELEDRINELSSKIT